MSFHFHSSLYGITKTVRFQPCHSWVSKKSLSYILAAFLKNHWNWPVCVLLRGGGAAIVHQARLLSHVGGEGRARVPTSDPHTINACWFLFLPFAYLLVAEAASFDKKSYAGAIHPICGKISFFFKKMGTLSLFTLGTSNRIITNFRQFILYHERGLQIQRPNS